jgi:hypothetical protein
MIGVMHDQLISSRLQEKRLDAVLPNLSMRSNEAKKVIVVDAGGIGAVALAIKESIGSPAVLERSTMRSLAVLEENQVFIANEGGIALAL